MSELTKRLRDRAKRYEWGMGYPELSRDEEVAELRSAADRIDKMEECLRECVTANDNRATLAVHDGSSKAVIAWLDSLGAMQMAWNKARALLGEE